MRYSTALRAILGAIVVLWLQLGPAEAQQPRYVATHGNDEGLCITPATACLTLQWAHDVAPAGAKIVVLDSGENETLVITKSIAIVAHGLHYLSFGGPQTQITVRAGPNDAVYLEGLTIGENAPSPNRTPSPTSGILFVSGGRLHVRNCVLRNFGEAGIDVRALGTKRLFVSDCTIANNNHGIWVRPFNSYAHVFLDRVTVESNVHGITSENSGARVRINNSTVTHNRTGLSSVNGGQLVSFGNNAIIANTTNGAPTWTAPLK